VGVDDYLTKPFVEDELKIRILKLLDNYHSRLNETESLNLTESDGQQKAKIIMGAADEAWLEKVEAVFSRNLSDTQFRIDWVADEIHLSERQFNRRLKQLTGLTPSQYLREMRLQTAKDFLHAGSYSTIKELSVAVGYLDTAYFSKLFQERFGVLPSGYLK
jgi:AraC-like DNA-binding protein